MSHLKILVSGAGIAGQAAAYFLSRAGAQVTIVENAPALRTGGQNVDIRGRGIDVIRRIGIEEQVRSRLTQEAGIAYVDSKGNRRAEYPVGGAGSMTAEIEIVRAELVKLLYEVTKDKVQYVFGNSVEKLMEKDGKVHVEFKDQSKQDFDLLIGADGLRSKTRALVFGDDQKSAIKSLKQYVTWFTIKRSDDDGTWWRWYNAPGRRIVMLRPDTGGVTSNVVRASLWICSSDERLQRYWNLNPTEQKKLMHELFDDAGWETSRVLKGMDTADDLYMQEVAQTRMQSWSHGRVALVGDAAYCPTPISGMGTTLALLGAQTLAEEIAKSPEDHKRAFAGYERSLRPSVANAQGSVSQLS